MENFSKNLVKSFFEIFQILPFAQTDKIRFHNASYTQNLQTKKHKREAHFSPRVCVFLVKLVERFGKRLEKSVAKIFYLGKVVIRLYLRFKSCLCLRKLAVARLQLLNALDVC